MMDDELQRAIRQAAEKHALLNAVKYESAAEVSAVMGPLMSENPEFRSQGGKVSRVVSDVVEDVNSQTPTERRAHLEETAPEALAELEVESDEPTHTLPALPGDTSQVRMRAAPNPNGPWHIGHGRMPAVIGTYKDRYDGSFIVRFDDTDPETKRPDLDAYDAILDDINYLGFEPDDVIYASDRLETYYEHAREVIAAEGAYTCSCSGEHFSALKNNAESCPHRQKSVTKTQEEFERMVAGEYTAGEMVLRIRTDINHKNPALRDWVGFRQIDTPHPRESASEYRCWPMLDFQSAIDDHLTGVTHIIRGIDLQDSAKRQEFLYDYLEWDYPEVVHWGHIQVDAYDIALSTSTIKQEIEAGRLNGWGDPRAPTIQSLRRRGIKGDAIVEAMNELGTSTNNVELSMSSIYANNRSQVDRDADRYFMIRDGTAFSFSDGPPHATPPLHPDADRGTRTIPVGDSIQIESADVPQEGERVWLKSLGCVRRTGDQLIPTGDELEVVQSGAVDVIHWVDTESAIPVEMHTPEGTVSGVAEPDFHQTSPDTVVQFERIGFARVDDHTEHSARPSVVYWTHS
ncbi:MAG: glutamyl-tRNA synthetase family protein [Haloquadratum sp. J07HQX50]|nr:MAG: glutamyl-tRNA synthetase family protein [Haloquadratum sp. J07HQX50]